MNNKYFKIILFLMFWLIFVCFSSALCYADEYEEIKDSLMNDYTSLYSSYLKSEAGDIINQCDIPYADGFDIGELLKRIAGGEIPLKSTEIIKECGMCLFGEIIKVIKSMLFVVVVSILSAYLNNISLSFGKDTVGKMSHYVCFIAVAGIAANVFFDVQNYVFDAIENLSLFMKCIVPMMYASLIASGATISAAALEPFLLGIIEIAVTMIKSVFFPLTMISSALGVVNSLSWEVKTSGLISLLNKSVKYGLSVLLTIFVAFAGIKSIAASGADGLTIKLTKFASSNLIPVVGGILSDSVETVMKCSMVIKNSLGILGVIVIFFIAIVPILKIAASLIVFRLTAAVCEPIGAKSVVECITSMASGISMAFSYLAAVEIMFIIILTIMINISL